MIIKESVIMIMEAIIAIVAWIMWMPDQHWKSWKSLCTWASDYLSVAVVSLLSLAEMHTSIDVNSSKNRLKMFGNVFQLGHIRLRPNKKLFYFLPRNGMYKIVGRVKHASLSNCCGQTSAVFKRAEL